MKSTLLTSLLILSLLLTISFSSFSQAGTLDSSFGVKGVVHNSVAYPCAVAIQSDDKIVVAGNTHGYTMGNEFAITRYQSNGNLDSSFGSNGIVTTPFDNLVNSATSLVIQDNGKIIVGGYDPEHFILTCYNPNGKLDSSFGVNGKVSTLVSTWREVYVSALALQNDGKILAGGEVDGFCLIRYLSNGVIDSSFGVNGRLQNDGDFRLIFDLAVLNNGKIIVGITNTPSDTYNRNFEIDRLLPSGKFDSTFGNNGMVITDFDGEEDWLKSIAIFNNNQIVALGASYPNEKTSLAKYKANGTLDSSFGVNGKLHPAFNAGFYNKVMIQQDGKLIVTGLVLARLTSNGSTDSTFGINGKAVNFQPTATNGVLQQDGKILLTTSDVLRYKGDEPVTVSILKNISAFEGNSGTTPVTFKIVLNKASTQTIKVNYTTQDGKAKTGSDYIATSETITFRPGQVSKDVVVNVIGDNVVETNEKFSLQLSKPRNSILGTLSIATCTIKNDDPSFVSADVNKNISSDKNANITIYPNPLKDVLKLEGLNAKEKTKISIVDMQGKVIVKTTVLNSTSSLNVKQLPTGIYLVNIETSAGSTSIKFVKE